MAAALYAVDYSGKYKGALESSAGGRQSVVATIRQQDGTVTGTIGPSPTQQAPLLNGKVEDGRMVFEIDPLGGLRMAFPEAAETLTGTVMRRNGQGAPFERIVLQRTGPLTIADTVPPLPNEGPFRSAEILKLRDDLARDPGSLAQFWERVRRSGAPLTETDPADERFQFATFLWQGKPEHKSVLVLWHPFATASPANFLMIPILGTDVWFRTVRVPRGARLKYSLSPNDPLSTMPAGSGRRTEVIDPLNTNGVLLDMPGSLPQPYYRQDESVAKLTRKEHKFRSERLNQERSILVYTPPNYDANGKPYPSVYLFDGEDKDGHVFATWTIENLIAGKKIPPVVVVRIVNPNMASRQQLAANPKFYEFLSQELVPYVQGNYNVSTKGENTVVGGYSLGGFAAVYAGLRHPDLFGAVLSQSGSFWLEPGRDESPEPNWMVRQFIDSPKLPLRFYMDAGQFEVDMSGRGSGILLPNRHLRDTLRAKGYEVDYREFPGGHDSINWRGTLADGLIALLGKAAVVRSGAD